LEYGELPPSPPFRSQVFSTSQRFPQRSNPMALFHATAARGITSLQSFPLTRVAHPSRSR
jgi:hypothetical protein